jgi:DNA polymerase sigma
VTPFGSSVNGFSLSTSSDVDMSINFLKNPFIDKEQILRLLREKIKTTLSDTINEDEVAYKEVVKTNVPLIKYIDKETKMSVDLIING